MNLKAKIPMIVILLIAVLAFSGGILQSMNLAEAGSIKETISELNTRISRMEDKFFDIRTHDVNNQNKAVDFYYEAEILDAQLYHLEGTISQNEKNVYLEKIAGYLRLVEAYSSTQWIVDMYVHFEETGNTSDYVLASTDIEGFEYTISSDHWNNLTPPPAYLETADDKYSHFHYYTDLINDFNAPQSFYRPRRPFTQNLNVILYLPIQELWEEVNVLESRVELLERQAGRIGLGVAITAVTAVITSTVAGQITEAKLEHDHQTIRAEIKEDEKLIKSKSTAFSIIILVLASGIAILGILIPLLMN
ncbi:MAG: hypothetical protein ACFFC7_06805 [Candidatus Hermodarchaeota archaeon]